VKPVQEVEREGDADQGDEQREGEGGFQRGGSGVVDDDALDLVGDVLQPVEHSLQV